MYGKFQLIQEGISPHFQNNTGFNERVVRENPGVFPVVLEYE
jgi:hypothetical protein